MDDGEGELGEGGEGPEELLDGAEVAVVTGVLFIFGHGEPNS